MAALYDRIDHILKQKHMTKKELANKAGMPYTTLMSAYYRGKGAMSAEYLNKIANVLEVPLSDLMNWDGEDTILSAGVKVLEYAEIYDSQLYSLLMNYEKLNETGKRKVFEYILDLSKIEDYLQSEE